MNLTFQRMPLIQAQLETLLDLGSMISLTLQMSYLVSILLYLEIICRKSRTFSKLENVWLRLMLIWIQLRKNVQLSKTLFRTINNFGKNKLLITSTNF
jgi:hypothetical protein